MSELDSRTQGWAKRLLGWASGGNAQLAARKRVEAALRESEERYRALFEQAVDSIVLINAESGVLVEFNDSAHANLGYTREDFATLKVSDLDVFESAEEAKRHIDRIVEEGEDTFETKHRTRDNEIRDVLVTTKRVSIRGRDFLLGIWRDITERKRDEQRMRLLSSAIEQSTEGIAMADPAGNLLFVNRAFASMHGYTPEELVGKHLSVFHTPEQMPSVEAALRQTEETGRFVGEICHVRRDGTVFPSMMHNAVIRDDRGDLLGMIGTLRDITVQKRMEQEIENHTKNLERLVDERASRIRELERQRGEMEKLAATGRMAAGVAHEINNPLAGIKNSFLVLKDAIPTDHEDYHFVGLILREIERIDGIVRQMYQLYRAETEEPEEIDLATEIGEVCELLGPRLEQRQLRLHVDVAPSERRLVAPPGAVRQILYNLLVNAVDASPVGGTLEVIAQTEDETVHMAVTDHGDGIPPDVAPNIFEPFFTTKQGQDNSGMGLGLAVSQGLAGALGGKITVATQVGLGTTFTLVLPCGEDFRPPQVS